MTILLSLLDFFTVQPFLVYNSFLKSDDLPRYCITQSASRFKGTQSADAHAHFIPFLSWFG